LQQDFLFVVQVNLLLQNYLQEKYPYGYFMEIKIPIVPKEFDQQFYKRLKRAGSIVRYSEYPGVEHNSWVNAFAEPELMSWLFSQVKK
jgi:hypothetical protein